MLLYRSIVWVTYLLIAHILHNHILIIFDSEEALDWIRQKPIASQENGQMRNANYGRTMYNQTMYNRIWYKAPKNGRKINLVRLNDTIHQASVNLGQSLD